MTYATVMVNMALDRSNDARLEIAGQLAERFGAHVIGVTAGEFSPPLYFTDGEQAQKVLDQGQAAIRSRIGEAEALATRKDCLGGWRRSGRCGGLRSLAASRMGLWWSNEGTHQPVEALLAAVAVKAVGN